MADPMNPEQGLDSETARRLQAAVGGHKALHGVYDNLPHYDGTPLAVTIAPNAWTIKMAAKTTGEAFLEDSGYDDPDAAANAWIAKNEATYSLGEGGSRTAGDINMQLAQSKVGTVKANAETDERDLLENFGWKKAEDTPVAQKITADKTGLEDKKDALVEPFHTDTSSSSSGQLGSKFTNQIDAVRDGSDVKIQAAKSSGEIDGVQFTTDGSPLVPKGTTDPVKQVMKDVEAGTLEVDADLDLEDEAIMLVALDLFE